MTFVPNCLATAVGTFPHTNSDTICRLILDNLPDVPIWPQLPKVSFRESMYVQFSERLPCVVVDGEARKIFFDASQDITLALEKFYERIIADDVDYFAISTDYSVGFHTMLELLRDTKPDNNGFVKGQVTGPISFGLTVTDENLRASLYNEMLADAIVKACAMNARWQVRQLKPVRPNVIIFIDEPYMASFGSAYISLSREGVVTMLNEVVEAIHSEGGLAGAHCCGNTDWSVLMETDIDILNFDAYGYIETLALYPGELKAYLDRGGILAWGIVPTSEAIVQETVESIVTRLEHGMEMLQAKGLDKEKLLETCLITPSCGTGSMAVDLSEKVLTSTAAVSSAMRRLIWHRGD
jgi:hypothetical protein